MVIVMQPGAPKEAIEHVIERVVAMGYTPHPIYGVERTVVAAVGDERGKHRLAELEALPDVDRVVPILRPYKLTSRQGRTEPSTVTVGGVTFGGTKLAVIAGPCSVEGREQLLATARAVRAGGAVMLRGGAFKPRTSPYAFQGLGEEGLRLLAEAREETGLPVVTEVVNPEEVELVARWADMIQVGARNVQNFALLRKLGKIDKPILLKRGMMTTVEEFLMAAEYILSEGNGNLVLCERGIRTFETSTRFTLDLGAVAVIKAESHLPVLVDPSHAAGNWRYVAPLALAAVAAGADGLIVEVHPNPEEALSDGLQSLTPENFASLMQALAPVAAAVGRSL
jgi:3-deoxy-7-phosphoheptulonate synthase